ncbi:MAG: DUF2071 domain-containing protein [Terracidiphilus sp.]
MNVLMLNYAADPPLLRPFVPAGTELDLFEGRAYVSLVGFEFNRTRVFRIPAPFHRSFEEVNLRFYVRRAARRGVVFIRELVPRSAVAAIARAAFGENYSTVTMSHRVYARPDGEIEVEYSWGSGPQRCSMQIKSGGQGILPADGSLGQFITEHYWGYSARSGGRCLEYEVQHPRWLVREGKSAEFSGDPASFYGIEFAKVLKRPPDSAFLAEGSPVTVFKGTEIN